LEALAVGSRQQILNQPRISISLFCRSLSPSPPPTFLLYDLVPREFLTQNPTGVTGNIGISRSTQGRDREKDRQ